MSLIRDILDAPYWVRCILLVLLSWMAILIVRENNVRRADQAIDALRKIHDAEESYLERQIADLERELAERDTTATKPGVASETGMGYVERGAQPR